jgi:hypothetical protein
MACCKKIDNSLVERHHIVILLESLKKEDITLEEMENVGVLLQKAGKRALFPLLRKLWQEKSGDIINRYVYLLDYFEDENWLDQLIRIALTRTDLEEEGKAALLAILEDYGIDISVPPFARVLAEISGPLALTLPKLLDKGEAGLVRFMEDFLFYQQEIRPAIVRHIVKVDDLRVLTLLGILLGFDDREVVVETINSLGKIRDRGAATLLSSFNDQGDLELRQLAEKNLRRLAFLGITPEPLQLNYSYNAFHMSAVSSIDGTGSRTLWFSRRRTNDKLDVLLLQIHETSGILDAMCYEDMCGEVYEKRWQEVSDEETLVEITEDYAVLLIRNALHFNRENCTYLPPEFYVWRKMLPLESFVACRYLPEFAGYDLNALANVPELIAQSGTLFEEEYFDGWFTADSRLFTIAEEFNIQEKKLTGRNLATAVEGFIKRFIEEMILPDLEKIGQRLYLIADLMQKSEREKKVVEKTLAVALSLLQPRPDHRKNPFLRQFALESLKITREALAEGIDLRQQFPDLDEDGELWD